MHMLMTKPRTAQRRASAGGIGRLRSRRLRNAINAFFDADHRFDLDLDSERALVERETVLNALNAELERFSGLAIVYRGRIFLPEIGPLFPRCVQLR